MNIPRGISFYAIVLLTISGQAIDCHGSKIKDHSPPSVKMNIDVLDSTKFDCQTCKSTIDSFVRNLAGAQEKRKDSSEDIEATKMRSCLLLQKDSDKQQCFTFIEYYNSIIDEWLLEQRQKNVRMFDFICISRLKLCCPANKFGPNCRDCHPCQPNRICDGSGTREGNGTCVCKSSQTGDDCSECLPGYYKKSVADSQFINCHKCHKSCKLCHEEGPKRCEDCESGFQWIENLGCVDIDECIQGKRDICGKNTFCVNTEGSFFCYECDRACDGCHGDGPDMCLKCGQNYFLDKGTCTAKRPTVIPPETNYYRYAVYLGLCISTCIILHNSIIIASLVGLAVACYIGLSEYTMSGDLNPYSPDHFTINTAKRF